MASGIYTQLAGDLADDSVNLDTDVIKVCLLNASHSFNAGHTTYADVSANEITGTNYVAGGATLSGQTIISDVWDATDQSWASATFTAYHAVLYDVTNANSLICSFVIPVMSVISWEIGSLPGMTKSPLTIKVLFVSVSHST